MARRVRPQSSDEDSEEYTDGESSDIERAFSELSSYYSGMTTTSSEFSNSEMSTSTGTTESSCGDEETTDFETDETSDSTHSSDTSFQLSTLIEETDRKKLAEFVQLRPADQLWIRAAWGYFDSEPTYRRSAKVVKVVRKIRSDLRPKNKWTELYREYYLRHPITVDSTSTEDVKGFSLDARYLPLPDLTV